MSWNLCDCTFVNVLDGHVLYSRRDLEMVTMLLCDHDSSSDGSSSEDDLEVLLLHLNEKPKRILGPRLNLEDLTNLECEQLFRLVVAVLMYI